MEIKKFIKRYFILALAIIISIFQIYYFSSFIVDDAYITFRYSKNLIEGKGLVFNEGERVEGITNFLYSILISFGLIFGFDPLFFSRIISVFSAIGIYFLLYKISEIFIEEKFRFFPILLLSLSSPFFYWTQGGLETIFFSFTILLLSYLEITKNSSIFYIISHILCITTRPEGFVVSFIVWVFRFFKKDKKFFKLLSYFLIFCLVYILFKFLYYGSIIPNTFYAKVLGPKLENQTIFFLKDYPQFLVFFLSIFVINKRMLIFYFIGFIFLLLPQVLGGDNMPFYRFYVHIIPIIIFCSTYFLISFFKLNFLRFLTIFIFLILMVLSSLFTRDKIPAVLTDRVAKVGIYVGNYIKKSFPSNYKIALNAIGTIGYYSERDIIDMLGLCDKHIGRKKSQAKIQIYTIGPGHGKGDGIYVFKKSPEIIIFGNTAGNESPVYTSDFELIKLEGFKENYLLKKIIIMSEEKKYNFSFTTPFINFYRKFLFISEFPAKKMFWARYDIGIDLFIDLRNFPPKGIVREYPLTLKIYVRKDLPIAGINDEEAILPPPLYPEEYYTARDYQDAGIWAAVNERYREAEYYLGKSLQLSNNFYTHFLLGKVYFLSGNIDSGIREMEEALKMKPDMKEAREELLKYKK